MFCLLENSKEVYRIEVGDDDYSAFVVLRQDGRYEANILRLISERAASKAPTALKEMYSSKETFSTFEEGRKFLHEFCDKNTIYFFTGQLKKLDSLKKDFIDLKKQRSIDSIMGRTT